MASISDKSFRIPFIYATGYCKTFDSGVNAPILVSGIDQDTHSKGSFVIKLKDGESMKDPSANMRELLAAFMAIELDVPVVQPIIAEVTRPFVETITNITSKKQAFRSLGKNYGSVYIDGFPTIVVDTFSDKLLPFAQALFAFDLLIQNGDRNIEKPNMLVTGKK